MSPFVPVDIPQSSMVEQQRTADIGTAIRHIPHTVNILVLEDKIQKPGDYLF